VWQDFLWTLNFCRFWPIMQIRKKGGWNLKKIFSSETTESISTKLCWNMPNLHNRYISAERKISQKNPEYLLNYSLPCSCSQNLSSFWLILKQQRTIEKKNLFLVTLAILKKGWGCWTQLQPRPPFKMAVVTKNINFFKCPLLL
jgi:hypothetical protein